MIRLVKNQEAWRSYRSVGGKHEYEVKHHQNQKVWSVIGGSPECYPIPADKIYFNSLADARAEVFRREGIASRKSTD